jgi:prepilin-type N-terminal cleavage/methylation domain-containing protein
MKKDKTAITRRSSGFSLIELLTVVSIMAILGTIAMPALRTGITSAQMARTTANARSIALGLRTWAADNGGVFPAGEDVEGNPITTSNDAFRSLIPYHIDSEKVFAVSRSAWGKEADGRMADVSEILEPGENHFAYIAGMSDTSQSSFPLVVDGTNGSGLYVTEPGQKGGCWEGRKAIVAYVGGNAEAITLRGPRDGERYIPREGYPDENALLVDYMGEDVELLEPAGD